VAAEILSVRYLFLSDRATRQTVKVWQSAFYLVRLPSSVVRVGSEGELFVPKELRDKAGLSPARRVIYKLEEGRLVVEPIPALDDLLAQKPEVEITTAEFKRHRRELSKKTET